MRILILATFLLMSLIMLIFKGSAAYFTAEALSSNNTIETAANFTFPTPQPSITPTPTPILTPCDPCCGGEINAEISGNGAGSSNEINIDVDCEVVIEQENSAVINNSINVSAESDSGFATSSAQVNNNFNTNSVN